MHRFIFHDWLVCWSVEKRVKKKVFFFFFSQLCQGVRWSLYWGAHTSLTHFPHKNLVGQVNRLFTVAFAQGIRAISSNKRTTPANRNLLIHIELFSFFVRIILNCNHGLDCKPEKISCQKKAKSLLKKAWKKNFF